MHVTFYENDAPKTVENFVKLAESGYYNAYKVKSYQLRRLIKSNFPD